MWQDILKVDARINENMWPVAQYIYDEFLELVGKDAEGNLQWKQREGTIEINPVRLKQRLEEMLGRPPTEKEMEIGFKFTAAHESGHAAHHLGDPDSWWDMIENDKNFGMEYLANVVAFPHNPYAALKHTLTHVAAAKKTDPRDNLFDFLAGNPPQRELVEEAKILRRIFAYVNTWAKTLEDRNYLTRIEMARRKKDNYRKNEVQLPKNFNDAISRYGKKHYKFVKKIWGEN
jgi:hypothetical protein